MARYLIVYYSRTGATHRVAKYLADQLGAELDPIEDSVMRLGVGGYVRSAAEALARGIPAVRTRRDPCLYDKVIVGTPVWVGSMASPVRSYLLAQRGQLRQCAFFSVMGGSGGEAALREMKLACGAGEVPALALRQREVEADRIQRDCQTFIEAVKALPFAPLQPALHGLVSDGPR